MIHLKNLTIPSLLIAASAFACSRGAATTEKSPRDTDDTSTDEALEELAGDVPVEEVQLGETPPTGVDAGAPVRPELTSEDCTAQGGEIVGDIGDGAIYKDTYLCPGGQAPTAKIVASPHGPMAVEGAVCCP